MDVLESIQAQISSHFLLLLFDGNLVFTYTLFETIIVEIVQLLVDLVKLRLGMGFLTLLLILVSLSIFEITLADNHTCLIALNLILNAFKPGLSIF